MSDKQKIDKRTEPAPAAEITEVQLQNEMEQSYLDYAMSVIAGRSLPDVRDGLKPVQRRILYAMNEMGVSSSTSHRKSSSIVGRTMGDFHPHGDSSIYDSLVRMAQDFSLRLPLIDGQGNFGSIDDDPPAAMRYTEARLASAGEALLEDIDKDTVEWTANYDGRLEEPEVLPASLPNLLINGAAGIAVGMSTQIPPHNPGEVIDATVHLIDNPNADTEELMEYVPGPDFPTGGTIAGREPIQKMYETGRGKLRVQANYKIEESNSGRDKIIITELPYQDKKARLIEKIADEVNDDTDRLNQIATIRDESDRTGMRIVIELKHGTIPDVVVNQLLNKFLEKTIGASLLALVDGQPKYLSLREALQHYIEHRQNIIRRRSQHELKNLQERRHILEGRLIAIDNADDIVELIQNTENRTEAVETLQEEYELSEKQAEHITRMQLGSLTSLERTSIEDEHKSVENEIEELQAILDDEEKLNEVVKEELKEQKEIFNESRRTNITTSRESLTVADTIPEEDCVFFLSESGYMKRITSETFSKQNRAGKGIIGANLKKDDSLQTVFHASTHDTLLFLTEDGNIHKAKGYDIKESGRQARGAYVGNTINIKNTEISTVFAVSEAPSEDSNGFLTIATANGKVKRTELSEYSNIQSNGIRAIDISDDDEIVDAAVTDGTKHLFLSTANGKSIVFDESDVRSAGRSTSGVGGIKLEGSDTVTSMSTIEGDSTLLSVTKNGYGKRSSFSEYRVQSRYGKGIKNIKTPERNGSVVSTVKADDETDIFVATENGKIIRTEANQISVVGRNTKGVKIMDVVEDDSVASVCTTREE